MLETVSILSSVFTKNDPQRENSDGGPRRRWSTALQPGHFCGQKRSSARRRPRGETAGHAPNPRTSSNWRQLPAQSCHCRAEFTGGSGTPASSISQVCLESRDLVQLPLASPASHNAELWSRIWGSPIEHSGTGSHGKLCALPSDKKARIRVSKGHSQGIAWLTYGLENLMVIPNSDSTEAGDVRVISRALRRGAEPSSQVPRLSGNNFLGITGTVKKARSLK